MLASTEGSTCMSPPARPAPSAFDTLLLYQLKLLARRKAEVRSPVGFYC
jgi:hypothetical protein